MRLSFLNSLMRPESRIRCGTWQRSALLVAACLALGACSSVGEKMPSVSGVAGLVTPYKVDVLQGNVVTREQVQALQPGLARDQVRGVLGSPLLTSVFHADRWDYVFTLKRQGQPPQQRRVTVFFKGDVMDRVESDELPSETEFVSSLDARRKTAKVPPLEATEEQLKAFQARNAGAAPAPAPVAPATETTAYPPLEPAGAPR